MIINKPIFWDKKKLTLLSIIFYPFSLIFLLLGCLKKAVVKKSKFDIPIICVGNIYIGGTGKTPLVIEILKILKKIGKKPVILKKYNRSHTDEINLIKKSTKDIIITGERTNGINEAIDKKFNVVISDDGLQDYSFFKDLNIVCFNNNQQIGNGFTIPSGPLREPLSALKNCKIAIINIEKLKDKYFEKKIKNYSKNISIFYSKYMPDQRVLKRLKKKNIFAFAGIGNTKNFFTLLKNYNLNVKQTVSFPDHYNYTKKELQKMMTLAKKNNYIILTTEKDYNRIKKFNLKKIEYMPVSLKIFNQLKLLKKIKRFI